MLRRGIFGGTFDPIHVGHLLVAQDVVQALRLDHMVFVPAPRPWMKEEKELAPAEDRCEMVRIAIGGNPMFTVSRVDMDRPGHSYAVDTMRDLQRSCTSPHDDYFVMGTDSLAGLAEWRSASDLLALCRIAAVERPGKGRRDVQAALERALPAAAGRVVFVDAVQVDISSSDIRRRCREGLPITYRVPAAVDEYIRRRGLYQ